MPHAKKEPQNKELALILLFMTPPYIKSSKEGRILVFFFLNIVKHSTHMVLAFAFSFLM